MQAAFSGLVSRVFTDWQRLFPTVDHRFQMGLRQGDARSFWSTQDASGRLWSERQRWLAVMPQLYAVSLPEEATAMAEARAWISQWSAEDEADWVLLSSGLEGESRVIGGEVVFPSSWSLPEKLGLPLSAVHGPVPGLETILGSTIRLFLSRILADSAWERDNWGLSADAEMNHHPSRNLPGLTKEASLDTTWLRLERQFLTRLPVTGALLFGIRVCNHRLHDLIGIPGVAQGLVKALETMPASIAQYKGLAEARATLINQIRKCPFSLTPGSVGDHSPGSQR